MDRHQDKLEGQASALPETDVSGAQNFGDDWVHEVIAMTRPGAEIQFPVRAINERDIPFVYDDFR